MMTISWDSLYLPSANQDAVATTLNDCLQDLGYQLYNPFGLMPGKSYPQTVRLFVAPPVAGWVRVIGSPDPGLLMPLSALNPCLYVALDNDNAIIQTYARGGLQAGTAMLQAYLRPGCDVGQLQHILTAEDLSAEVTENASVFDKLPDDIQALASQVDRGQAQQMFERLSANLMNKTGGAEAADDARDLISGKGPNWNSPGGRRLHALMRCLTVPDHWREPDFGGLRDAYQLHNRRQRQPNARLYPGDEATMKRVADALDYVPVYGGRDN